MGLHIAIVYNNLRTYVHYILLAIYERAKIKGVACGKQSFPRTLCNEMLLQVVLSMYKHCRQIYNNYGLQKQTPMCIHCT